MASNERPVIVVSARWAILTHPTGKIIPLIQAAREAGFRIKSARFEEFTNNQPDLTHCDFFNLAPGTLFALNDAAALWLQLNAPA